MIGAWSARGGPQLPADPAPYRHELATCIGLLHPAYRLTLWLHLGGQTQAQIGASQGVGQDTISTRLARIRRWLALAVPARLELRERDLEVADPVDRAVFDAVVWLHRPISSLGSTNGYSSDRLWRRFRAAKGRIGLPDVVGTAIWAAPGPF